MWYVVSLLTGDSQVVLEGTVKIAVAGAYVDGWELRMALAKIMGMALQVNDEVYVWRWPS